MASAFHVPAKTHRPPLMFSLGKPLYDDKLKTTGIILIAYLGVGFLSCVGAWLWVAIFICNYTVYLHFY